MNEHTPLLGLEPTPFHLNGFNKTMNYELGTFGRWSYIAPRSEFAIRRQHDTNHILIGNFSSIGHEAHFVINAAHHEYRLASTFPFNETSLPAFSGFQSANNERAQIIIGSDVWIGGSVTLLGGVRIGHGAVVASHAVVTKDVPPYTIVGGNPIRKIKDRTNPETKQRLLRLRWWEWSDEKLEETRPWFDRPLEEFATHFAGTELAENTTPPEPIGEESIPFHPGNRNFLHRIDREHSISIVEKIVREYTQTFSANDAVTLFLVGDFAATPALINTIQESIDHTNPAAPRILLHQEQPGVIEAILPHCACFIAGRDLITLHFLDLCDEAGIPFVSGVDTYAFGNKAHVHQPFTETSRP